MAATYLLDVALEGMFGQKRFGTGLARIHFATLSRGRIGFHVGSSAGRIGRNIRLACERKRADNHLSIGQVLGPNSYFSRNFSSYFSGTNYILPPFIICLGGFLLTASLVLTVGPILVIFGM